jgi:hypothetical protein
LIHFEKNEIGEAALSESPGDAETGDTAAYDDDWNFFNALGSGERSAVAQEMAHLEGIVDEPTLDLFFTFEGKADERRAAETEKFATAQLQ